MFFLEDEKTGELIPAPKNEVWNGLVYHVTADEWPHLVTNLYNHCNIISFGGELEPFTEELYHHLQTLPGFFEKDTIEIYRDGCLIFSSNKTENRAVVDFAFISDYTTIYPPHHPIIRSYQNYVSEYTLAKEQGKLYSPENLSIEEYKMLIAKLFSRCDSIYFVTDIDSSPISGGAPAEAPEYSGKYERSGYNLFHYSPSEELKNTFLQAHDFFSFGETTDVIFSRKGKTVLCTKASEHRCIIDPWYLEETDGLLKTSKGTILSEELAATLMNIHGIASREEFENSL